MRFFVVVLTLVIVGENIPTAAQSDAREHTFLHRMIDHHRVGQKMADLCIQNASHEELKRECTAMKQLQGKAIAQMLSWSELWFSTQISEHQDIMKETPIKKIRQLQGVKFDGEFLKQAAAYHADALNMSSKCAVEATHKDLNQFCNKLSREEQVQASKFKQLQQEWFGKR